MKYILSLIILTVCGLFSKAEATLIQQADSAYTADNFKEAADTYLHVIATEGNSATLQYNLGNCYYRLGEMGKAILAYERALRFDPTFHDARTNLEFINSRIADRPGDARDFFRKRLSTRLPTQPVRIHGHGLHSAALFLHLLEFSPICSLT